MKVKIGLMSIMLLVSILAMAGTVSAATVNLVEKNPTDWSVVSDGKSGTLVYTMPDTTMVYTFTLNTPLTPNTVYCLVFYTRNSEGISWRNSDNEVWGNQGSRRIRCATTDCSGYFPIPMSLGTFNFDNHGTGLDYINDGDDYDGSVLGAKVWLVPSSDLTGDTVTGWNPSNFLWEEDLITPTPDFGPEPGDSEAKFVLSELGDFDATNTDGSVVATLTCGNNVNSEIQFTLTLDGEPVTDGIGTPIGSTTMVCHAGTSALRIIHTPQTPNDIEKKWWLYVANECVTLNYVEIEKNIGLPHWEVLTPTCEYEIPEFSTIAIPVAGILGLLFFFNHRKRKKE
ncbi:MAG: PEF-CTERM sorting domain-containing protein [Methanophagales archaeon]|nr:PEF-CTERM sorting domain-containing protein [Methanophagales archaeon]